jgi:hypothetical protein
VLTVDSELLLDILRRYGVPEHLVNLTRMLHTNVVVCMTMMVDVEVFIPSSEEQQTMTR